jgi:tRNA A37 threonylcarbamoyladenosine synthetase subunit TsaC/SUA5/YrdC
MNASSSHAARQPDAAADFTETDVRASCDAFAAGGLVLLKGDIGYGLLGHSEHSIRKMYQAKGRVLDNPCIVIGNLDILRDVALIPNAAIGDWIAATAAETTLAVVLPVNPNSKLLGKLSPWVYGQTVTRGTIAVFLNVGPFLEEVIARLSAVGLLVVGSSANPSAQGNIYRFEEIPAALRQAADFAIDHGRSKYANPERKATTIVNFTNWTLKRRGVNWEHIEPGFLALQAQS